MDSSADSHRRGPQARICISPEDNLLLGAAAIKKYLRIRSWATLYRLVELYGLPAVKRPDGKWMTTVTAIDDWLFLAAEADASNRKHLRGSNERLEVAQTRIARRIAQWDALKGAAKRWGEAGSNERSA